MNIKEIVLEAGHSTVPAYWLSDEKPIACSTSNLEKLVAFAEALIVEIAKQNEPISLNEPNYHYEAMGCGLEDRGITDRYEAMEYGWNCAIERMFEQLPEGPLFTFPPTAEQIANETAEAIAEYCRNQDHYCLATEIESGAWKEFKK